MRNKTIVLSDDQYENLVTALAIRCSQYKNLSQYVERLVGTLPDGIIEDVSQLVSCEIDSNTSKEELYRILMVMDSQKRRSSNLEEHFKSMAKANPNLYSGALDLVFDKKINKGKLGKLIRSRLAISAAKAKINHKQALNNYMSLYINTRSVDSEEVIRTYFENFPEYKTDIIVMSKMVSSSNGGANLMAVRYADDSILTFLVNVRGKQAKQVLENRISNLQNKTK
tara:strand:- start:102 stop:779 length:678 start_codon:yes stop_codon:yes gene_type:complete